MTDPAANSSPAQKESGLVATFKGVVMTPTSFFERAAEGQPGFTPVGFAVVVSSLSSAAAELGNSSIAGGTSGGSALGAGFRGAIFAFLGTYAVAGIMHLLLRFILRTGQPFQRTLASTGYASAGLVVAVVPIVGGLVALLWQTVLTVIGVRVTHRVSLAAAIGVVLMTFASPVLVALGLRAYAVEAFKIPAMSMAPTLWDGDHIFVSKSAYGVFSKEVPERGDVIVFPFPENPAQDFVKRVIGLPGDTIEVIGGRPVINGFTPPQCRVGTIDVAGKQMTVFIEHLGERSYLTMFEDGFEQPPQGPYEVKAGDVFVLGDNRHNSHDSRQWNGGKGGGVPFESIRGRASVWFAAFGAGRSFTDRAWDEIHGLPLLPDRYQWPLSGPIDTCMSAKPPVTETTPPSP
ncbi:MAG: signal peptidase I [Polyangiaceae bacterium]|nr:signal peptidase I [Polyangiaceae bacterium]